MEVSIRVADCCVCVCVHALFYNFDDAIPVTLPQYRICCWSSLGDCDVRVGCYRNVAEAVSIFLTYFVDPKQRVRKRDTEGESDSECELE